MSSSEDEPDPDHFEFEGDPSPEDTVWLLESIAGPGHHVVELDPSPDGTGDRILLAVEDGYDLTHEDRMKVLLVLMDQQEKHGD